MMPTTNEIKKSLLSGKNRLKNLKEEIYLWIIRQVLKDRFNERKIFLITSTPRSGSTLLSDILNNIPRSCMLFEPLHLDQVPRANAAGFQWRTYKVPNSAWVEGKNFLYEVFRGNAVNKWTAREIGVKEAIRADKLIVKCVRANRLLPWICHNFNIPTPILLIRHPCAVIASQLKSPDWNSIHKPLLPEYVKDFPLLLETYHQAKCVEEYLAISWALDQLPSFIFKEQYTCIILTYEELLIDTCQALSKISNTWKVELPMEKALATISRPSSVVYDSGISGIEGWKKQLSKDQIRHILRIVHGFGLKFYTEKARADSNILNNTCNTDLC